MTLSNLFSPIRVGTMALDHRLVVPPHGGSAGTLLGPEAYFEQYCRHWLAKVEGGVQWVGGRPNYVLSLIHISEPTRPY